MTHTMRDAADTAVARRQLTGLRCTALSADMAAAVEGWTGRRVDTISTERAAADIREKADQLVIAPGRTPDLVSAIVVAGYAALYLPGSSPRLIAAADPVSACALMALATAAPFDPAPGLSLAGMSFSVAAQHQADSGSGPGFRRTLTKLQEAGAVIGTEAAGCVIAPLADASMPFDQPHPSLILPCADPDEAPQALWLGLDASPDRLARIAMAMTAVIALPEQAFLRWMI